MVRLFGIIQQCISMILNLPISEKRHPLIGNFNLSLPLTELNDTLYENLRLNISYPLCVSFGENLFHLVCRLNIKCLITIVWKLAEKVFKEEAKDYFMIENTFKFSENKRAFNYTFDVIFHTIFCEDGLSLDSKYFKSIEDLRRTKRNDRIDFNDDKNFHLTPVFLMIEIAKGLNYSQEQKLILTNHQIFSVEFKYYLKEVFFQLNVLLKIKTDLFLNAHVHQAEHSSTYSQNINFVTLSGIITSTEDPSFIYEIFDFYQKKVSSSEYKVMVKCFFVRCLERKPFLLPPANISDECAKVMFSILKSTLNESELIDYFSKYAFLRPDKNDEYNYDIKRSISLYCMVLPESYLKHLMLNNSNEMIILWLLMIFRNEISLHTLNELKKKMSSDKVLLALFNESSLLSTSAVIPDKFEIILQFYRDNFEKSNLCKYVSKDEIKSVIIILSKINELQKMLEFLEEIYDERNWKNLLLSVDENKDTILHKLLGQKNHEKIDLFMKFAKNKLKKGFFKLLTMKNCKNQSCNELKKLLNKK